MSQVNTVLGPLDSADMGFTLSNENMTRGADATQPSFNVAATLGPPVVPPQISATDSQRSSYRRFCVL